MQRIDGRRHLVFPGLISTAAELVADPLPGLLGSTEDPKDREGRLPRRAQAHGEESVICAAFSATMAAIRAGTTTVFHTQDTPGFVRGSTTRIREVLLTAGLRGVVAYRLSDQAGPEVLKDALEETRESVLYGGTELLRHGIGLGRLDGLDEATLVELGELANRYEAPILGEIGSRPEDAKSKNVARLDRAGLLTPMTVLRAGPHVSEKDRKLLKERGVTVVLCPRSELRRGHSLPEWDENIALGSGECLPDLFSEFRLAADAWSGNGYDLKSSNMRELLCSGFRMASRIFDLPFGNLEPGAAADLVIINYQPNFPLNEETVIHHLLGGLLRAPVVHTIVAGRILLRENGFTSLDARALLELSERGALDYYRRLTGESFPGYVVPEPEPEPPARPEPKPRAVEAAQEVAEAALAGEDDFDDEDYLDEDEDEDDFEDDDDLDASDREMADLDDSDDDHLDDDHDDDDQEEEDDEDEEEDDLEMREVGLLVDGDSEDFDDDEDDDLDDDSDEDDDLNDSDAPRGHRDDEEEDDDLDDDADDDDDLDDEDEDDDPEPVPENPRKSGPPKDPFGAGIFS
jgi:cytosine/adenosine deaminase-related metal-dependent hydrolase